MKKVMKFFNNRNNMALMATIFGTILYIFGVVFILDKCNLYAAGITGVAQLIQRVLGIDPSQGFGTVFLSIMIVVFNIPLFIISWKGVSKRFASLSLLSVILQFVCTTAFVWMRENGLDPFESMKAEDHMLTFALLGGLLSGLSCGFTLRYGTSTGGTDVLSQYLSLNKQISFTKFSLIINLVIVAASVFFGSGGEIRVDIAVYTVISMIISNLVLGKIHTIYKYEKVTIITEEKQRMRDALIKNFNHGVTIYQAVGAFSNKTKYTLEAIVWSFESIDYIRVAKEIDPDCFIVCTAVTKVSGYYNVNTIA